MLQRSSSVPNPSPTRLKIWLGRIYKFGAVSLCGLLVLVLFVIAKFNAADRQHAAFQKDGESIKAMLSEYGKAYKAFKKNPGGMASFFASDFNALNRGEIALNEPVWTGDVYVADFRSTGNSSKSVQQITEEIKRHFDNIERIELSKFKINLVDELEPGRTALISVKHVLTGELTDGQSFEDRVFYRWNLTNRDPDNPNWRIASQELISGVRTTGDRRSFASPEPSSIGINYQHRRNPKLDKTLLDTKLKFAVVEHSGGGLSAADYDNDGDTDLLFLDGVSTRLFKNLLNNGPNSQSVARHVMFRDVTESVGLPTDLGAAHSGLFFDFDNDGDKDLFVARYLEPCRFFLNENNCFEEATAAVGLGFTGTCSSCCILDYDRDGYLDLYVGMFGNAFETTPDIPFYATNGKPNRLFRNVNGKAFEDVTDEAGVGSTGWTLATTSGDFDADGFPDLAVANDFGRKVLYRNNRDGTFSDVTKEAGVLDFSGGMGVSFCDLNGDQYPDFVTANIDSGVRWFGEELTLWQYMRNTIREGYILQDWASLRQLHHLVGDDWKGLGKQIGEGNSVFLNLGNGTFEEWKDCNANRAGWAWSINAFDYDLDGDQDLYCSNGWVSSTLRDDL